jgi:hypothetical protein
LNVRSIRTLLLFRLLVRYGWLAFPRRSLSPAYSQAALGPAWRRSALSLAIDQPNGRSSFHDRFGLSRLM